MSRRPYARKILQGFVQSRRGSLSSTLVGVTLIGMQMSQWGLPSRAQDLPDRSLTHPLMPGVRCDEIWNTDWPRTMHDRQITGFSPLVCGMKDTPQVWSTIEVGGTASYVAAVKCHDGVERILVSDTRLRLIGPNGDTLWTSDETGTIHYFGKLLANDTDFVLLSRGSQLVLVHGAKGHTEWSYEFGPSHVELRVQVDDILLGRPGLEAAVFQQWGEQGCLINFSPHGEPDIVWQQTVVIPGQWNERFDHDSTILLDLSRQEEPIIWNVRHHRFFGIDARNGDMITTVLYSIGGKHCRNYGTWSIGHDSKGQSLVCVLGESVQKHVPVIRPNRDGPSELVWQHYYGEVYKEAFGVLLSELAIADVDADGATEIVYSVCDPAHGFRSFVRVRDAATGKVESELADCWGVAALAHLDERGGHGLLVYSAADGTVPHTGDLQVYRFAPSRLVHVTTVKNAQRWGPLTVASDNGDELLLKKTGEGGEEILVRYRWVNDGLQPIAQTTAAGLIGSPARAISTGVDGGALYILTGLSGRLAAVTWEGTVVWEHPLFGGNPPRLSAADLDRDGTAELVAATVGDRVRVYSCDSTGMATEKANHQFRGSLYWNQRSDAVQLRNCPLLYDLEGTGQLCLVAPGTTDDGRVAIRAYRGDSSLAWESRFDVPDIPEALGGMVRAWNAGHFLPGGRAALAISVADRQRTFLGTYLLDGPTGKPVWFRGLRRDGDNVRPYISYGLPTVFDIDGDGVEEIGMDVLSYMAFLRGTDGSEAYLRHTRNISQENALYAAELYNSYCPVYKHPSDKQPHWFVPLGHGMFGLMHPEPTSGIWREELGYDIPTKAGMIDVDADGVMEVGYAALRDETFICRDLWTGKIEWELELPEAPNSPVIAADVDGDGKGEFLIGRYCIGTGANGEGGIRWESPVPLGWAVIADFDGDERGEIACPASGRIHILKAVPEK